jgi:hypothetical protein
MSRDESKKQDEILRKIEKLSEGMEPPATEPEPVQSPNDEPKSHEDILQRIERLSEGLEPPGTQKTEPEGMEPPGTQKTEPEPVPSTNDESKKYEEIIRKIEELSEGMEPPGTQKPEPEPEPESVPFPNIEDVMPPIDSSKDEEGEDDDTNIGIDFDKLSDQTRQANNVALTSQGILEQMLTEMQLMNNRIREMNA